MDKPNIGELASVSELKARLYEKERVENYLRSEVAELWNHVNELNRVPFLKTYLKLVSALRPIVRKILKALYSIKKSENQTNLPIQSVKSSNIDILLVLPTNKIEIGGLVSATKLVKQLGRSGFKIGILCLNRDPSVNLKSDSDFIASINEVASTKLIICSGAETIGFVKNYVKNSKTKTLLLMQGPDPFFTPKFEDASDYLMYFSKFDSVLTVSPYLKKLATYWGAKKIVNATLGPDSNIFMLDLKVKKLKQIVVPCRFGVEKGLRFLIPTLKELRNNGWTLIGFGDLPDLSMASYFDNFLGRISSEETSLLFKQSMILIDPSIVEGLGLSTLESARCGCIPIIQKRGGFEGLFEIGKEPFIEIVNFLDPEVVVQAVHKAQTKLSPTLVSSRASIIDWNNGYEVAKEEISELLSL